MARVYPAPSVEQWLWLAFGFWLGTGAFPLVYIHEKNSTSKFKEKGLCGGLISILMLSPS